MQQRIYIVEVNTPDITQLPLPARDQSVFYRHLVTRNNLIHASLLDFHLAGIMHMQSVSVTFTDFKQ